MADVPLAYEQIKDALLRRLGQQWRPGTRLPPSWRLAQELGVGQRNTHRAMAELAAEGYLISRPGKGTYVNPRLAETLGLHRSEAVLKSRRVCFVQHGDSPDPFRLEMARGARQVLEQAGATCREEHSPTRGEYDIGTLAKDEAVVLINPRPAVAITLDPSKAWLVLSTTVSVTLSAAGGYDLVAADEQQGGYLAGEALRRAGCKSACFVGVDRGGGLKPTCMTRFRGMEVGFGQKIPPSHLLPIRCYDNGAGARAVALFNQLNPRPDGVFCTCDDVAMGFAMGMLALNFEPGRDYKLVGFDGQHAARQMESCPPLTTVAVPAEEMGRRGGELLVKRLIQPERPSERHLLSCTLFAGATAPVLLDSSSQENES